MTPQYAKPLPECGGCARPIRRRLAQDNGGYCTTCRPRRASPVKALPEELLHLQEWQATAHARGQAQRDELAARRAKRRQR